VHNAAEGRYTIVIDADASTDIANFDFDHLTPRDRHDLLEQGPACPMPCAPAPRP
jgi:hypothetical protein